MSDLLANAVGEPCQCAVASLATEASSRISANQLVFLDHDGAQDVSYRGPIPIENLDIPTLDLSPFDPRLWHFPAGNPLTGTGGQNISDGDTSPSAADGTAFGSVAQGDAAISRTLSVRNDGNTTLTLSGLTVPSGFTVTNALVSSLAPGASDTFTIRLDTATAGTKSGQIRFTNNDSNENPFNFSITGTVTSAVSLDQSQTRANYGFWFEQSVARWQEFTPSLSQLRQVSLLVYRTGNPGDLWVAVERVSDGQRLWSTRVSQSQVSTGTAWLEVPVTPALALSPGTKYRLVVWGDSPSPNPSNRYFWKGQARDNAYAEGDSCVEHSWPGYDFAFKTYGS